MSTSSKIEDSRPSALVTFVNLRLVARNSDLNLLFSIMFVAILYSLDSISLDKE